MNNVNETVINATSTINNEILRKKELGILKRINKVIYFSVKRIFDLFVGLVLLILMFPIALIIKISYLFNGDKKPIIYSQVRIGKNGKQIKMYKFRSMVHNADEVLKDLLKKPEYKKEWDMYQKLKNDPRITSIGKFIRKTSIDEVPQCLNILKGDMSVVGPRPLVSGELEAHGGNKEIYQKVRPGLTSWWASNGRSDIEYNERLDLEYYYVKNMSAWLDIKCIFKTAMAVLGKKGAK